MADLSSISVEDISNLGIDQLPLLLSAARTLSVLAVESGKMTQEEADAMWDASKAGYAVADTDWQKHVEAGALNQQTVNEAPNP